MSPCEQQAMALNIGMAQDSGRTKAAPATQLAVLESVPTRVHLVIHGTGHNESSCLLVLQMGLLLMLLGSNCVQSREVAIY